MTKQESRKERTPKVLAGKRRVTITPAKVQVSGVDRLLAQVDRTHRRGFTLQ